MPRKVTKDGWVVETNAAGRETRRWRAGTRNHVPRATVAAAGYTDDRRPQRRPAAQPAPAPTLPVAAATPEMFRRGAAELRAVQRELGAPDDPDLGGAFGEDFGPGEAYPADWAPDVTWPDLHAARSGRVPGFYGGRRVG